MAEQKSDMGRARKKSGCCQHLCDHDPDGNQKLPSLQRAKYQLRAVQDKKDLQHQQNYNSLVDGSSKWVWYTASEADAPEAS